MLRSAVAPSFCPGCVHIRVQRLQATSPYTLYWLSVWPAGQSTIWRAALNYVMTYVSMLGRCTLILICPHGWVVLDWVHTVLLIISLCWCQYLNEHISRFLYEYLRVFQNFLKFHSNLPCHVVYSILFTWCKSCFLIGVNNGLAICS